MSPVLWVVLAGLGPFLAQPQTDAPVTQRGNASASQPHLSALGTQRLVTWIDTRLAGHSQQIFATLLDASGAPVSPAGLRLTADAREVLGFGCACSTQGCLLAWRTNPEAQTGRLRALLLDAQARPTGSVLELDPVVVGVPTVAFDGTRYVLGVAPTLGQLSLRHVSLAGAVGPAVLREDVTEFFLSADAQVLAVGVELPQGARLRVEWLDATLAASEATVLPDTSALLFEPSLGGQGDARFLAFAVSRTGLDSDVVGYAVHRGAPLGARVGLAVTADAERAPTVGRVDGTWLAAFQVQEEEGTRRIVVSVDDAGAVRPLGALDAELAVIIVGDAAGAHVAGLVPGEIFFADLVLADLTSAGAGATRVISRAGNQQTAPALAAMPDGTFLAAWEDRREGGADLAFTRVDAHGALPGAAVHFVGRPAPQTFPTVAVSAASRGVVVWTSLEGSRSSIVVQAVDATGAPDGAAEVVALAETTLAPGVTFPHVAAAGEGFLVVWTAVTALSEVVLEARWLDHAGHPVGSRFRVAGDVLGNVLGSAVVGSPAGAVVAGTRSTETSHRAVLWHLGLEGQLQEEVLPDDGRTPQLVSLAQATDGRLWAGWIGARGEENSTVVLERTGNGWVMLDVPQAPAVSLSLGFDGDALHVLRVEVAQLPTADQFSVTRLVDLQPGGASQVLATGIEGDLASAFVPGGAAMVAGEAEVEGDVQNVRLALFAATPEPVLALDPPAAPRGCGCVEVDGLGIALSLWLTVRSRRPGPHRGHGPHLPGALP